jgi:hypothetical protein
MRNAIGAAPTAPHRVRNAIGAAPTGPHRMRKGSR